MSSIRPKIAKGIQAIADRVTPPSHDHDVVFDECVSLRVLGNVFDPSIGRSARKMARAIKVVPPGGEDRILDIGTGSGVQAILLNQSSRKFPVVAADIMPEAIACARINFHRHNIRAELIESDLFQNVPTSYRFDYIVFNAPTAHPLITGQTQGLATLWDGTGMLKQRFLEQARAFLSPRPQSKILMVYSRYADYDSLASLDLSGFDSSHLLVDKDDISEFGVLMLMPKSAVRDGAHGA